VLALLLGVLAALALTSCGSAGSAKLLAGKTAGEITTNLDEVKRLAKGGECVGAEDAAQQVSDQIDALGGIDKKLKQALREGATRLNEVVSECNEETTETTESEEEAPEATTTRATKKEEKPSKPKPTTTPPSKPKPTPTQTTPSTPTTTTPPPSTEGTEAGGTGAPSGGVGAGTPLGGGH
jgi:outer membrane biosynthesis protein TonB